ncbi:ABC transporter ATP-binding protein [Halobacteriovorax sp. HLS]|uniref:ABC transporter ATP-binding protein n=1 Tax=Halobacteriovorax sp. HLS TaxID=2234000 RepID=UPI000FDC5338|nr:ABC transporter ATP-binding protein [Halobacteriovorax sp. HLS]
MEESALEISHIQKNFPGTMALDDISFTVSKGSIHGFLGPNGAGKSTTMKIITGILQPCSGELTINSERSIGFLPENPPLYKNMDVRSYLDFVKSIYKSAISVDSVLEKCGLLQVSSRLIRNLSKGYQQRVGIAQALVVDPEIIILDEPTVGLDPHAIKEIRELILSLKNDHTILFSTHQLYEASNLCDEVTIIHKGRILKTGKIEDVKKDLVTGQVIKVELDSVLTDEDHKELMSSFEISSIEYSGAFVIIYTKNDEDIRGKLNKFLMDKNYNVNSLSNVEIDLEQIFERVTGSTDA